MTRVPPRLREEVRERAHWRCEYCHKPEGINGAGHQADHIIPERHTGTTELINLAWACFRCNHAKSTDIASYDVDTKQLTPLYNPRIQDWNEHFRVEPGSAVVMGKTRVGRVTIRILNMNHPTQIAARHVLMESGRWE